MTKRRLGLADGYRLVDVFLFKLGEESVNFYAVIENAQGKQDQICLGRVHRVLYGCILKEIKVEVFDETFPSLFWKSEKAVDLLVRKLIQSADQPEYLEFNLKETARQICVRVIRSCLDRGMVRLDVRHTDSQKIRALAALLDIKAERINHLLKMAARCG